MHGISGDLPIVLVKIDDPDDVGIVRQLLRAHAYWRLKRLAVDLVILNDRAPSYLQDLQTLLETLVRTSLSTSRPDATATEGRIFTMRSDQLTAAQLDLLESVARVELSSRRGTLAEQVQRGYRADGAPGPGRALAVVSPAGTKRWRSPPPRPLPPPRWTSNSPMAWAGSTRAGASTSSRSGRASGLPRRGSTCSRTRSSADSSPSRDRAAPGR